MSALLEVRSLRAGYGGIPVLDGIGFSVEDGGVTAILGANGAGKTTILRAVTGMIERTGDIVFRGRGIGRLATPAIARLGIAHVPDGRGTFAELTVEENMALGAITRRDRAAVERDRDRLFALFPRLRERRTQIAGTLSGGEQQMLALSRALMSRPSLLLLDEPSFGLAPRVVQEMFEMLRAVLREDGVSILLVEQNAQLALDLADQAFVIETGRIVLSGDAARLAEDPAVRRAYLGAGA